MVCVDEDNATELSEVPLIEDIPEIIAEEEDGRNDKSQDDSNGNVLHSSDTEPGDTSNDELEVDQVYLTDDDLSTVENATPAPIIAAEGLVLDEYFKDSDHSFCDYAEDDGNESDDEGEQEGEAEMEKKGKKEGKKEDKGEDDGSWRVFDKIIWKPFKNDEFMLEDSKRSLRMVLQGQEESWSCHHINPNQPRIPMKILEPKKQKRVRVITWASAVPRSPTPLPVPAQLTIKISDTFTKDGQPVVEELTFC
ncbi:hypothetical protein DAEQUDRAFT_768497 [Daedalea quercina L-15889]|uniref:Uncharacterized protein n=1 Tax=Daedalea quercina L-15889 TaxID=1314783 RepID=A0A165MMR4_9APHY|nr:hypothetical protein DAEQUDRAFT_768497 [Daedalea quercina L-15889]